MTAEIALDSKLDLPASESLAEALRDKRGTDLSLDGSQVEHLGAHALQTLLVARKSWAADGKCLTLAEPSDALSEQVAFYGLALDALSTPEETS